MAREAFVNPRVVQRLARFFPAHVNAARQPELLDKYHADTWPITLLIGPDGREIERATGYRSTAQFLAWLEGALAGRGEYTLARAAHDAAPDDPQALARYGRLARVRGEADAGAALERALALDPDNARGGGEIALAWLADRADAAGEGAKAVELREKLRAVAREPENYESAMLGLAFAKFATTGAGAATAGAEGMALLDELIRRYPKRFTAYYFRASRRIKAGGDRALAIRDAETAAGLAPDEHFLPTYVAKLYAEGGDYRNAVKWQRRAVKVHPWAPRYRDTLREYEAKARL